MMKIDKKMSNEEDLKRFDPDLELDHPFGASAC